MRLNDNSPSFIVRKNSISFVANNSGSPYGKGSCRTLCATEGVKQIKVKPHRQHLVLPPLLRRRPLLSALQTFPPINGGISLLQGEAVLVGEAVLIGEARSSRQSKTRCSLTEHRATLRTIII